MASLVLLNIFYSKSPRNMTVVVIFGDAKQKLRLTTKSANKLRPASLIFLRSTSSSNRHPTTSAVSDNRVLLLVKNKIKINTNNTRFIVVDISLPACVWRRRVRFLRHPSLSSRYFCRRPFQRKHYSESSNQITRNRNSKNLFLSS